MRASLRPAAATAGKAFVHDAADSARAPPALRAAAEAAIDLVGRGRAGLGGIDGGPHVAIAENVAGTNDHTELVAYPGGRSLDLSHRIRPCKKKNAFFEIFQTEDKPSVRQ